MGQGSLIIDFPSSFEATLQEEVLCAEVGDLSSILLAMKYTRGTFQLQVHFSMLKEAFVAYLLLQGCGNTLGQIIPHEI